MYGVENRNRVYEYFRTWKTDGDRRAMTCRKILSSGKGIRKYRVMPVAAAKRNATRFFELRIRWIMP
jgi:hypothetical protein